MNVKTLISFPKTSQLKRSVGKIFEIVFQYFFCGLKDNKSLLVSPYNTVSIIRLILHNS